MQSVAISSLAPAPPQSVLGKPIHSGCLKCLRIQVFYSLTSSSIGIWGRKRKTKKNPSTEKVCLEKSCPGNSHVCQAINTATPSE